MNRQSAFTQVLTSTQAKAVGTVDGGGGGDIEIKKEAQVSEKEIEYVINKLSRIMKFVFYFHEMYQVDHFGRRVEMDPVLVSAYKIIFQYKFKDIYKTLEKIKFTPRRNQPCQDLAFNDRDGSAFNEDKTEICLSVERIKSKVNESNFVTEIVALAGHEVAHRMGANEPEAKAFQKAIEKSFNVKDIDLLIKTVTNRLYYLRVLGDDDGNGQYEGIQKFFLQKTQLSQAPDFCQKANIWNTQIKSWLKDAEVETLSMGAAPVSVDNIKHVIAMDTQVETMLDFCWQEKPKCDIPRPLYKMGLCNRAPQLNGIISLDILNITARSWRSGTIKHPGSIKITNYLDKKAATFNFYQAIQSYKSAMLGVELFF